ncbi:MAG TPA: sodium-translocating pyrophosphatase [Methanoregulaceae archaeon]|nr:sodium-translocating pyrophosphatase [Methanoregulaceae archaeon]HQJ86926.1 sodium-translocating pyrophosphatase [Methanoregulaceae archaeon]
MYIQLVLTGAVGVIALLMAGIFAMQVMRSETGTQGMRDVAAAIKEGAQAFIRRQYTTIAILGVVTALLLIGIFMFTGRTELAIPTAIAFLFGAAMSGIAGIIGMWTSVHANLRSAAAARTSLGKAIVVALRGGAVSGLTIVALSLLGVSIVFTLLGGDPERTPSLIVGFGFGASFIALFAQLGGGIYTKAADVGADLVGKVEAGIPEDDPRNPAVIADLVGDNVGDCAGRGADLFESTVAENIGAMILGVALYSVFGVNGVLFPLVAGSLGLIATIIGILTVTESSGNSGNPMDALNRGYYVTALLSAVFLYFAIEWLLGNIWFFYAAVIGLVLSVIFLYLTLYYTDSRYRPVRNMAKASVTGSATNIISGISVGFETTGIAAISIGVSLLAAYFCGQMSGVTNGGLYGTAVATIGMLAPVAYILAMDTFGPIVDNAGGIVEMSGQTDEVIDRIAALDSAGNTTKALTKGYAVGSAALSAFLLFNAYMSEIAILIGRPFEVVNLANLPVFVGALFGAMLIFVFASLAISAVGKTAQYIIEEVRRQFKNPGILAGTVKPDYGSCVDITTRGALKNMVAPGVVAIVFPAIVGISLKFEAMAGFLMVATIVGIMLALVLNNSGGAWDNVKKFIESGEYGGKGSETHKAAVVGDTVGDPFKDTAGPSLHVLVKLLATTTLVLSTLYI